LTARKALQRVFFWIGAAMAFNIGVYLFMGQKKALEFLGGYVIEQSLSMDNLFLFLLIFSFFGIPERYQRRVLDFGIIGAVIFRFIFIVLGVSVVEKFHWVLNAFGLILILSGINLFFKNENEGRYNFKESIPVKLLGKFIPVSPTLAGQRFLVRKRGILYATPLLAILVLIEGSDILFAIDSIPAIFAITTDTFIVYTSNLFAILNLRSLYFVLQRVNYLFDYVKYGVGGILIFTGTKLTIMFFHVEISLMFSLLTSFSMLALSILASVFSKRRTAMNRSL
jgi:tellurite resistance protein TerC